jgi:hypothetical protein
MEIVADLIKLTLSFWLTYIIGTRITQSYQRRNFLHQVNTSKTEKEIERVKKLAQEIEKFAGMRIFHGRELVSYHLDGGTVNQIATARIDYKKSVREWNENLSSFFIELRSLGLYRLAIRLENNVHDNMKEAHYLIDKMIRKEDTSVRAQDIGIFYKEALNSIRENSILLMDFSNEKWERVISDNKKPLNKYNIKDADFYTLIIALFHKMPNTLRVKSSSEN